MVWVVVGRVVDSKMGSIQTMKGCDTAGRELRHDCQMSENYIYF